MVNLISKKYLPKITFLMVISVLLSFWLFLIYNQKRMVFAQGEISPTVCERKRNLEFPYIDIIDEDNKPLAENMWEMPIGQSTDEIEDIADDILKHLGFLIAAAQREAEAAELMSASIGLCGEPEDYDCDPDCRCQFDRWDNCECTSSKPAGKYNCNDYSCSDSDCPGGECKDECTDNNPGCSSFGKCSCPCPADLDCGNGCYCDKKERDCYCEPIYKCVACPCTCDACPRGSSMDCPDPDVEVECPDGCALTCPTCPPDIATHLGNPADTGTNTVRGGANDIKTHFDAINNYFLARFLPAAWVEFQYGKDANVADFMVLPSDWPYGAGDLNGDYLENDQNSMDLCVWLHASPDYSDKKLCITPIDFATTGDPEGILGKLNTARSRFRSCKITASLEEPFQKETTIWSCQGVLEAFIPIHSFLEISNPTQKEEQCMPGTQICKGCHGQHYCESEGKGYCAEDYFCCP